MHCLHHNRVIVRQQNVCLTKNGKPVLHFIRKGCFICHCTARYNETSFYVLVFFLLLYINWLKIELVSV